MTAHPVATAHLFNVSMIQREYEPFSSTPRTPARNESMISNLHSCIASSTACSNAGEDRKISGKDTKLSHGKIGVLPSRA
ncbi:MAG TPA: hypothetical protein VH062_00285 [Polyangiaceae bacterium]|nr:hypothetical protein [Polyangiaceae bacterium]